MPKVGMAKIFSLSTQIRNVDEHSLKIFVFMNELLFLRPINDKCIMPKKDMKFVFVGFYI